MTDHREDYGQGRTERRVQAPTLKDKIKAAKQEFATIGTAELNATKTKLEAQVLGSLKKGEASFTTSCGTELSPKLRETLVNWARNEGVEMKWVDDQRGSFFQVKVLD